MKEVKWLGTHTYKNKKVRIKQNGTGPVEDKDAERMKNDFGDLVEIVGEWVEKKPEKKEEAKTEKKEEAKTEKKEDKPNKITL
jgi:hypothetical protein